MDRHKSKVSGIWYPRPRFYVKWHELVKCKAINWEQPVEFHDESDGFNKIIITLKNVELKRKKA